MSERPELPELTGAEALDPSLGEWDAEHELWWYDLRQLTLEGRGWPEHDLPHPYARLPRHAEPEVRAEVWHLSQWSAGLRARFISDAPTIWARWTLGDPDSSRSHMAATGTKGVDLYTRSDADPRWRFAGVGRPKEGSENEAQLVDTMDDQRRAFMLHLPLYNLIERASIGVPDGATIAPAPPMRDKPIVCYGTSIVHGGCACRPGMSYPAQLARRLGRETINLGFGGNGKAEPEVAALLAELDPAVYMVDPLPNISEEQVTERIEPFMHVLRAARSETPIVLVENVAYTDTHVHRERRTTYQAKNAALRAAYERLMKAGVEHLHYVPSDGLLGDDDEATVDGTHPTDLGFVRMVDAFEPVLRRLL